jgi:hypothetical protein
MFSLKSKIEWIKNMFRAFFFVRHNMHCIFSSTFAFTLLYSKTKIYLDEMDDENGFTFNWKNPARIKDGAVGMEK